MGDLPGPSYQLHATQAGKIVINQEQIIMGVVGKPSQGGVTVCAKLDVPFQLFEQILNQSGDELVIFNVQDRSLGC